MRTGRVEFVVSAVGAAVPAGTAGKWLLGCLRSLT